MENTQPIKTESPPSALLLSRQEALIVTIAALTALALVVTAFLATPHQASLELLYLLKLPAPLVITLYGVAITTLFVLSLYILHKYLSTLPPSTEPVTETEVITNEVVNDPPILDNLNDRPILNQPPPPENPPPVIPNAPPLPPSKPSLSLLMTLFKNAIPLPPSIHSKWVGPELLFQDVRPLFGHDKQTYDSLQAVISPLSRQQPNTYDHELPTILFLHDQRAYEKLSQILSVLKECEAKNNVFEETRLCYEQWMAEKQTHPDRQFYILCNQKVLGENKYTINAFSRDEMPTFEKLLEFLKSISLPPPTVEHMDSLLKLVAALCYEQPNFSPLLACQLFEQWLTAHPEWRQDLDLKSWVASTLIYLKPRVKKSIDRCKDHMEGLMGLRAYAAWQKLLQREKEWHETALPNTALEKPYPPELLSEEHHIQVEISTPVSYPRWEKIQGAELLDLDATEKTVELLKPPEIYPTFENADELDCLQKWKEYFCATCSPNQCTQKAEEAFAFLKKFYQATGFEMEELTEKYTAANQLEILAEVLYTIANRALIFSICAQKQLAPHPAHLLLLLNVTACLQSFYQNLTLDTSQLRWILNDEFLLLGPYQHPLFYQLGRLDKGCVIGKHNYKDRNGNTPEAAGTELTGPKKVVNLFYLIEVLLGMNEAEHDQLPAKPNNYRDYDRVWGNIIVNLTPTLLQKDQLLSLHYEKISVQNRVKKYLVLPLLNLRMPYPYGHGRRLVSERPHSDENFVGPIHSSFYPLSGPFPAEIRTYIANGVIGEITGYQRNNQEGKGYSWSDDHAGEVEQHAISRKTHGYSQTSGYIEYNAFCYPDLYIELSRLLSRTATGRTNRASSAIYLFSDHPELFCQEKWGEAYLRLFRLLVFRSDLLLYELDSNPKVAPLLLRRFDVILEFLKQNKNFKAWSAVYKIHADLVANLRWQWKIDPALLQERSQKMKDYRSQLQEWLKSGEHLEPLPLLHFAFLYGEAVVPSPGSTVAELAVSIFRAYPWIENALAEGAFDGKILSEFIREPLKEILSLSEGLDGAAFIKSLFNLPETEPVERKALGIWKLPSGILNIHRVEFIWDNEKQGLFPQHIRDNPQLIALLGEKTLKQVYSFKLVNTHSSFGPAWYTSCRKGEIEYSFFLKGKQLLLFRQDAKGDKQQWLPFKLKAPYLPSDLKQGFVWAPVTEAQENPLDSPPVIPQIQEEWFVENAEGLKLYMIRGQANQITRIQKYSSKEENKETLLEPLEDPRLSCLAHLGQWTITRSATGKVTLSFSNSSLSYFWNSQESRWESNLYKGYFLSDTSLNQWHKSKNSFFHSTFKNYHLLEKAGSKEAKLILPCLQYKQLNHVEDTKNSPALIPLYTQQESHFAFFDISKKQWPQSQRPRDLFYIAYLLFVQRKYVEALVYLEWSQQNWVIKNPEESALRDQILTWFIEAGRDPKQDPDQNAFLIQLLLGEHALRESCFVSQEEQLESDEKILSAILMPRAIVYDETKTHISLRITEQQGNDLKDLIPRAYSWVCGQFQEGSHFQKNWTNAALAKADLALEDYFTAKEKGENFPSADEMLRSTLKRYKEKLQKKLKSKEKDRKWTLFDGTKSKIPPYVPQPLLDLSKWFTSKAETQAAKDTHSRVKATAEQIETLFSSPKKEQDTMASEIGKEIGHDIQNHLNAIQEEKTLRSNLTEQEKTDLEKQLSSMHKELKTREQNLKNIIVNKCPVFDGTFSEYKPQQEKYSLEEIHNFQEHFFETLRHCFALQNSDPLKHWKISEQTYQDFMIHMRNYEIARTERQLLARKLRAVRAWLKDPTSRILLEECVSTLLEWRQYDPWTHPYAHLFLLLEDSTGKTARGTQVQHILELIEFLNAFKHEMMAGGKTTFIRILFNAIETTRGYLAGVFTYQPLITMQHPYYAHTHRTAYGAPVLYFDYNRGSPHDSTSLTLMYLHHVKLFLRGGRLDQTIQSLLSLDHTLTDSLRALKSEMASIEARELKTRIDSLQDLIAFLRKNTSFYSDELDKINDPTKMHDYAIMSSSTLLHFSFYEPALHLFRILKIHPQLRAFKEAMQKKRLLQFGEIEFEEALRLLAEAFYTDLKLECDRELFLDYLTERHRNDSAAQAKIIEFYQNVILNLSPEVSEKIQMAHFYLGVLFRDLKNKVVGVHCGFSKDGKSVKPFSMSNVCQESSQRDVVPLTILEYLVVYLVDGVSKEALRNYLELLQLEVGEEMKTHKDFTDNQGRPMGVDQMPTAVTFEKNFGVKLSQVTAKHYDQLIAILEKDESYSLFDEFISRVIFKNFIYHTEKIEGNSQDIPSLIHGYCGSSGSPERVKTLPHKIQKPPQLARQKGAIGSVFYNFLKGFDDNISLVAYDPNKSAIEQIAACLNPGDFFIDNVPFFPGKSGLEIARLIQNALDIKVPIRFLDAQDQVCILHIDGTIQKGQEGIDLENTITIIDQKGRQGTDLSYARAERKGILGLDQATDLTSFYQSLMRLRGLENVQKAVIFYDKALLTIWEAEATSEPALQNQPLLLKILWTLVKNEAALLKSYHFRANHLAICAIRKATISKLKGVKESQDLIKIKSLPSFQLTKHSDLSTKHCGAPLLFAPSVEILKTLAQEEQSLLRNLLDDIRKIKKTLQPSTWQYCKNAIKKNLLRFEDSDLIMPASDLPPLSPQKLQGDATSEMEVEITVDQQLNQENQLTIDTNVNLELTMDQEKDEDMLIPHPREDNGDDREDTSTGRAFAGSWGWCSEFITDQTHKKTAYGYFDPLKVPHFGISNYGLGIGGLDFRDKGIERDTERKRHFWFYELPPVRPRPSRKVCLVINGDEIHCQMASISESDWYFPQLIVHKKRADLWQGMPYHKAVRQRNLSVEQQEAVNSRNADRYDYIQQDYVNWKKTQLFIMDLSELSIPESVPHEQHEKWISRMTLAKFIYAEAPFSEEEANYLINKLIPDLFPEISLDTLIERLTAFLQHYYPNTIQYNPLLTLLKSHT